jgi:hypothetical protein
VNPDPLGLQQAVGLNWTTVLNWMQLHAEAFSLMTFVFHLVFSRSIIEWFDWVEHSNNSEEEHEEEEDNMRPSLHV